MKEEDNSAEEKKYFEVYCLNLKIVFLIFNEKFFFNDF